MVGYGPEDDHFVAELTYNYSGAKLLTLLTYFIQFVNLVRDYERGNSHIATLINSAELFQKFKKDGDSANVTISSPSGYKFRIENR